MELDQHRFRDEYLLESAHKTLNAGTIASWLSLPVIIGFTLQDIYVLHLHNVWLWRLSALVPFLIFLGYRYFLSSRHPLWAIKLNSLNIIGVLTMMTGIAVVVLADPDSKLLNQYGVSAGLITALFVSLIMASGARKNLTYLIPACLLLGTLSLLWLSGENDPGRLGFLSNSFIIGLVVIVFARIQDRNQQKSFFLRKKIELRENQLAHKTEELEKLNKNLESFSYTVSHDLKGPIRNMMGLSTLIGRKADSQNPAELQEMADAILHNARKMNKLVEDILAFSRSDNSPVKRKPLDMTQMFREVYEELRSGENGRDIQFYLQVLEPAKGDPNLIRQLIINLVGNALKFTRKIPHTQITVEGKQSAEGEYTYMVQDNGTGFDELEKEKLFEPFQRLHREDEYEGEGIGLSFVQKIVEKHKGKIWAEGTPGRGATFFFTLPMQPML